MANRTEFVRRVRRLYRPRPANGVELQTLAREAAGYWMLMTFSQQNAAAALEPDVAIWKAAWDMGWQQGAGRMRELTETGGYDD